MTFAAGFDKKARYMGAMPDGNATDIISRLAGGDNT